MIEAVIEPKTYFNLKDWFTDWNLSTFRTTTIVDKPPIIEIDDVEDDSISELLRSLKIDLEDDSITELRRSLKQELPVKSTNAEQKLLAALFGLAIIFLFLKLHQNRTSGAEVSSKESTADTPLTAAPDAVQAFFQRAESRLSTETEITAQRAQNLLRRIKELVVKICPKNLEGRMLALVDKEDRSTTIEWIRNRSRLGFVLDNENESSWFILLPNGLSRSGYLYGNSGLESLRGLLEEFIAAGE
jgi:hypothetical protein